MFVAFQAKTNSLIPDLLGLILLRSPSRSLVIQVISGD